MHRPFVVDLCFCGREENQYCQFFGDIVKTVRDFGGDEEHTANGNFPVFVAGCETSFSAEHVVHLVFMMRALRIGGTSGENV